jgi:hypothetical protein
VEEAGYAGAPGYIPDAIFGKVRKRWKWRKQAMQERRDIFPARHVRNGEGGGIILNF